MVTHDQEEALSMADRVAAAGFEQIDPRSSKLDVRAGFVDTRWNDLMRQQLAALVEQWLGQSRFVMRSLFKCARLC